MSIKRKGERSSKELQPLKKKKMKVVSFMDFGKQSGISIISVMFDCVQMQLWIADCYQTYHLLQHQGRRLTAASRLGKNHSN